jgi:adenylate kinase
MQKNIFIFMGAPGSGKGTLSSVCKKKFGWKQLSTGDLCRNHMQDQTEIGKQITKIIAAGELVADDIIAEMVKRWLLDLQDMNEDIIFDGYPRTLAQAKTFCELLAGDLQDFQPWIIKLDVSADAIVERLLSRAICVNKDCQSVYSTIAGSVYASKVDMICDSCGDALKRRIDDTRESIVHRISVYRSHEQEIIDFFMKQSGLCDDSHLIELNGNQTIEEILNDFKKNNILKDDSKE